MSAARDQLFGDPELRILRELERELMHELDSTVEQRNEVRQRREAKQRLRRQSVRVTRRALMLVALVSLIGSSALAASLVLGKGKQTNVRPAVLAAGQGGGQRWQLEAYVFHGNSCYVLFAGQTEASRCIPAPEANGVSAVSALLPGRRLVAGLAGADTEQVHVQVGGDEGVVSAHPLSASGARRGGVHPGLRWFVATLSSDVNVDDALPALLRGISRNGDRGAPSLDCSLGGASAACRRAAQRIAAGESGAPAAGAPASR